MRYLDIDLWPAGLVLAVTLVAIVALRVVDRYATKVTRARTREALRRAVGDPAGDRPG